MLKAIVTGRTLVVGGQASIAQSYERIGISLGSVATVTDNNAVKTVVPIEGNTSQITRLDLRDVTGAGAYVYVGYDSAVRTIVATQQGDYIYSGYGDDRVLGLGGDDYLFGNGGKDVLEGGAGSDRLDGGAGDDTLTGGAGNDAINGGEGIDTAIYTGNRSDYRLEVVNGTFQLTDLRTKGSEGVDTIGNVEFLKFADQTFAMPGAGFATSDVHVFDGVAYPLGEHVFADMIIA